MTMTVLLLSTAVGGPIGTAAAATTTEDCSGVDALIYDMVTVGEYSLADQEEHPCSPAFQRSQAIEDLKNASAEQEKLDIYNAALAQKADNQVFSDVSANYLNDSRSIAWMHAETALAKAYKNGDSKAVAKSKAKQAIQDYYANKQVNMLERWNVSARAWATLRQTAENQSGISSDYVHQEVSTQGQYYAPGGDRIYEGVSSDTVTLVNSSSHGITAFQWSIPYDDGGSVGRSTYNYHMVSPTDSRNALTVEKLQVSPPNGDYSEVTYLQVLKHSERWDRIQTLNSDLQSEVDPFVNATWTAFQNGEIRASDVISRNNLMFRYGTDALNNSNQSLYDSTAALATMGLDTPNISSTGSMTVQYENVTYTGMVLAQEAPGGSWQTGTTYNTSDIGGVVLLATTDGERIDMKGEFTLTEMKNQDGEQIEETQATKVVYKTSNTTELLDKMDRILELRAQIESTKPKAGGGSTSDGASSDLLKQLAALFGISSGMVLLVLAGAALVVYKVYTP